MEEDSFYYLWALLVEHGAIPNKKNECEQLWNSFSLEHKRQIYTNLRAKIRQGKFVNYNPVQAVKDNAPRAPVMKIISSDAYYQMYGTQEEKDGWHRKFLPNQHKTIYYKQN